MANTTGRRSLKRIAVLCLSLLLLGWLYYFVTGFHNKVFGPGASILQSDLVSTISSLSNTIVTLAGKDMGQRHVYERTNLVRAHSHITNELGKILDHDKERTFVITNQPVLGGNWPNDFKAPRTTNETYNVIAERKGTGTDIIIIGAHYDTMPFSTQWDGMDQKQFFPQIPGTPGANDNASGVAALLEIAKAMTNAQLKSTVRLVVFANEEPPFFNTELMGSRVYVQSLGEEKTRIKMMISLDVLAVYSRQDGNDKRSPTVAIAGLPNDSKYVAFMSNWKWLGNNRRTRNEVLQWAKVFATNSIIPVRTSALPWFGSDVFAWSDDASFVDAGIPAFCVTDTAMYRSDRYHEMWDTPENITAVDYEMFAAVTHGLIGAIKAMAGE